MTGEKGMGERIRRTQPVKEMTDGTVIGTDITCSQELRRFFEEKIGGAFKFHVDFQKWLKANPNMTLGDAAVAYRDLRIKKKDRNRMIDPQFEYNTYIRDFFADNKEMTLDDAIKCWRYKKSLPGNNRYERNDLDALKFQDQ